MLKHSALTVALLVAALLTVGCETMNGLVETREAAGHPDEFFLTTAAHTNAAEIEAAELAIQRTTNPQVRQFAQQIIQDHARSQQRLNQVADQLGINVPDTPDPTRAMLAEHLQQLQGPQFDREYISAMVADHARTLSLFEDKAQQAQTSAVRNWARQEIPGLRHHLQQARRINQTLGGASTIQSNQ